MKEASTDEVALIWFVSRKVVFTSSVTPLLGLDIVLEALGKGFTALSDTSGWINESEILSKPFLHVLVSLSPNMEEHAV